MSEKRLTLKESWNSLTKSLFFFSRENVEACVYYWTIEGLLYLAMVLICFRRLSYIAHWDEMLIEHALQMTLTRRQSGAELLQHSASLIRNASKSKDR